MWPSSEEAAAAVVVVQVLILALLIAAAGRDASAPVGQVLLTRRGQLHDCGCGQQQVTRRSPDQVAAGLQQSKAGCRRPDGMPGELLQLADLLAGCWSMSRAVGCCCLPAALAFEALVECSNQEVDVQGVARQGHWANRCETPCALTC